MQACGTFQGVLRSDDSTHERRAAPPPGPANFGANIVVGKIVPMSSPLEQTLIVMPALNEEEAVGHVVREVREKVPSATVLVIDDGSTDRTAAEAHAAGALVLSLPFNLGVGGAMRVGFKYALAHGFSNVVQVDSDGQHDPSGVPDLVAALESADVVLGARFAGEGDYTVAGPRRWAMVALATIISALAHTKLTDTTSGFRATGPRAVRLFAEHYPAEYLGDTIESLVIAARAGCVIRQLPVAMRPRAGGIPSHDPVKAAAYLGRAGMALLIALMKPRVLLTSETRTA
jgi:glycosyltransferase involved in cell wall biosynthesis